MPSKQTASTSRAKSSRRPPPRRGTNGVSKKFSAIVETIGPKQAKKYLDMMPHNRRQRGRVKDRYIKAMAKGQWKLTGEAIKFNTRGELIDGQHRLEAIIATGKTVEILVCRNVPPEAFMELDTGANRTPADLLTVAGYNYTSGVASAIRHITSIYKVEAGTVAPGSLARERIDPETLLEYAEAHSATLIEAVQKTMSRQAKTVLSPPSMYAALYYIFSEHNKKAADQFFQTLIDGIGYERGRQDPIYQLHRLLGQFKNDKHHRRPNFYKCAITIKAWNAFQMREPIGALRFTEKEGWPEINRRKVRVTEALAAKRDKKRERDAKRKEKAKTAAKKKASKRAAAPKKKKSSR
jgi:hypothetical protein